MNLPRASLAVCFLTSFLASQVSAQPREYDPRRAYEPIAPRPTAQALPTLVDSPEPTAPTTLPRTLPAKGLLTSQGKDPKEKEPKEKEKEKKDQSPTPVTDAFAQAP